MHKLLRSLDTLSRVLLLAILLITMAVLRPQAFWNHNNLQTVIFQQAPFTILMSFGMTLAIITKGIDKSMGSVLVLSNAVSAVYFQQGHYLVGLLIALGIGIACGCANGTLITRVGVAPFIATYGVDFVALGLAYVVTNGIYIYSFPDEFRNLTNGYLISGIPNIALITCLIFAVLYFITRKTIFGRGIYSSGFNFNASILSGIDAKRTLLIVYIINGVLASLTGILYMSRLNSADSNISGSFTLDSIAASLIGGTSFGGGKGSVVNAVIGALIIVFIRNSMNILNISTNWQQAVVGAVIIISVLYEFFINRMLKKIK